MRAPLRAVVTMVWRRRAALSVTDGAEGVKACGKTLMGLKALLEGLAKQLECRRLLVPKVTRRASSCACVAAASRVLLLPVAR